MGRLVEPEKYDPARHYRWGPILIDKWAVRNVLPVILVVCALYGAAFWAGWLK